MAIVAGVLPDDPVDLRQFCLQILAELDDKQHLIDKLAHELALFRRYLYGRRSEKLDLDPAQLLLEFTSWLKAMNTPAPAAAETAPGAALPAKPLHAPRERRGH